VHRSEAFGTKSFVAAIGYSRVRGRRILVESRHSVDTRCSFRTTLLLHGVLVCAIPPMSWGLGYPSDGVKGLFVSVVALWEMFALLHEQ